MPDDLSRLEQRFDEISRTLVALQARLDAVETELWGRPQPAQSQEVAGDGRLQAGDLASATPPRGAELGALSLIGRTLIVMAGAFLLRATTEAQVIPQIAGSMIGLAYGLFWLVLADRAARGADPRSARFHGLAAALIAYPLLWEATAQFGFLPPILGAVGLAVVTAAGLGLALRRRLRALAWMIAIGTGTTSIALALSTHMLTPFAASQILLCIVVLWSAYARGWYLLAIVGAAIANLTVFVVSGLVILEPDSDLLRELRPKELLVLQLSLAFGYFGSFLIRTIRTRENLHALEMLQAVAALGVGFGGVLVVSRKAALSTDWMGVLSLAMAVLCYGMAFTFIDRRLQRRTNFIFFTSIGLVTALFAIGLVMTGPAKALTLAALALAVAFYGSVRHRATLNLHASFYAVAAVFSSGMAERIREDLFTDGIESTSTWSSAPLIIVLSVVLICCALPVARHGRTWGRLSGVPRVILLLIAMTGIDALIVSIASGVLDGQSGSLDPASRAALRTVVLSLSAIVLGWLVRRTQLREAIWLVYLWLIVGAVKLVVEDLPAGRSATLFVSLLLYGLALIVAPRLGKIEATGDRSQPA